MLFILLLSSCLARKVVYFADGRVESVPSFGAWQKDQVARGDFESTLDEAGWMHLKVESNAIYSAKEQLYAAGVVEGELTHEQIFALWRSIKGNMFPKPPSERLRKWLNDESEWIRSSAEKYGKDDARWQALGAIHAQIDGLYEGYKRAAPVSAPMTFFDMQTLSANGDMGELRMAVGDAALPVFSNMTSDELLQWTLQKQHCSVLIRATPLLDDVFIGHSTWSAYNSMLRIYKRYSFPLKINGELVGGQNMSFSSYPGFLVSVDDFYMSQPNNLTMVETTNPMYNVKLWKAVGENPHLLLAWHRVRLSQMLAYSGAEWAELFKFFSSGTYANQYMILDWKRVERGVQLWDGALTVVENMPTLQVSRDETKHLASSWWQSYNVPYFKEIYDLSLIPQIVKQKGVTNSYEMAPRARIFRRDAGRVETFDDYMRFMRYNDYKHDPLSQHNPFWAICSRGDLVANASQPFGCIDSKVTRLAWASSPQMRVAIVNGPTRGGKSDLKPFTWREFKPNEPPRFGQPETFAFDFKEIVF